MLQFKVVAAHQSAPLPIRVGQRSAVERLIAGLKVALDAVAKTRVVIRRGVEPKLRVREFGVEVIDGQRVGVVYEDGRIVAVVQGLHRL
jgi:hypothetical protein